MHFDPNTGEKIMDPGDEIQNTAAQAAAPAADAAQQATAQTADAVNQAAAAQAAAASDEKAPEAENTEAGEEVKTESPFKSIIPPKTPLQDEDKKTPSPSEPVKSIIPQMPPAKPVAPQNNPFVFKPQTSGEDGEKSE